MAKNHANYFKQMRKIARRGDRADAAYVEAVRQTFGSPEDARGKLFFDVRDADIQKAANKITRRIYFDWRFWRATAVYLARYVENWINVKLGRPQKIHKELLPHYMQPYFKGDEITVTDHDYQKGTKTVRKA